MFRECLTECLQHIALLDHRRKGLNYRRIPLCRVFVLASRQKNFMDHALLSKLPTFFRDIQPDTVCAKRIFIGIESFQAVGCDSTFILVHRGILLVSEHDSFAKSALSSCLSALRALRLLLIAFQLARSACKANDAAPNTSAIELIAG